MVCVPEGRARAVYFHRGGVCDRLCGVVVLVVGREPDYIPAAARKRDEPARRVC